MIFSSKFFDVAPFDYNGERSKFIANLDMLKAMPVEEQTLYKKWQELNFNDYRTRRKADRFESLRRNIWTPSDIYNETKTIEEVEELNPVVELTDDIEKWTLYRMLISSMDWTPGPGRSMKFFVRDSNTNKLLGIISLASDVTNITVRDKYIGWTEKNKYDDARLNNTAIASTLVAVQPLGHLLLGTKLIAALATTTSTRNAWRENYGDRLVGVTTTSLYGIHSVYNGIPHWKTLGVSAGKVGIRPDDDTYKIWHDWIKINYPDEYKKTVEGKESVAGPATGVKQKILKLIYKKLDIRASDYEHGYKRGVYFSNFYENGLEFLAGKITENDLVMKKKFVEDYEYVLAWWKRKAIKRYKQLLVENRIKPDILFYADVVGMSWFECRKIYLKEVGR